MPSAARQGSITDRPYDNGGMDYLSIAGGLPFTNEFLLDGAPNTNTERSNPGSLSFVPPPEATEEVAVITNNYDAQYGRTGGGMVSATLRAAATDCTALSTNTVATASSMRIHFRPTARVFRAVLSSGTSPE